MKIRIAALLVAFLIALPVFAHGDKVHVMGTVEKLSAESLTVKTLEGKSVEVKLTQKTAYLTSAGKPARFDDLAVGQRVVIHADPRGTDLLAVTVKLAAAAAATSSGAQK